MPVPSTASATAVVGSALLSRNSRTMNAIMGRMTSAKTNSASITRWLLTARRDAKPVSSTGTGATNACASTLGRDVLRINGHFE
jgi:hypothetical protein